MDFESSEWKPFPAEWVEQIKPEIPDEEPEKMLARQAQDSLERCVHPETGVDFESYLEDGQRKYFHEETNEWVEIPMSLEIYVPTVEDQLDLLTEQFPDWSNKKEQLMALRQNRYDVDATIRWRHRELGFSKKFGDVPSSAHVDSYAVSSSNKPTETTTAPSAEYIAAVNEVRALLNNFTLGLILVRPTRRR